MADNVAITEGAGTTIAADEVVDGTLGTVKVQYVKLMDGSIDGTSKAAVSANGLKVDLGADNDVTTAADATDGSAHGASQTGFRAMGSDGTNDQQISTDSAGAVNINNISGAISLPTGAATAANQSTGNSSLSNIDTNTGNTATNTTDVPNAIGTDAGAHGVSQKGMRALGSDGTNDQQISTDSAGAVNINNVSGAISLPTGASTAANQSTANSSLSNIDTNTGNVDTNTTDLPNVIGTDGAAGPTKAISIAGTDGVGNLQEITTDTDGHPQVDILSSALPTGAATSANQTTSNTNTGNIDTNTTDIPNVIGTDGLAGPTKAVSMAGTDGTGNLRELLSDVDGHLQVDVLTGGGSGTEYTEDAAAPGDPVGGAQIMVRADTPATITSLDGDNIARRSTNYGAAYCQIVTSSGSFVDTFGGGQQYTEGDTDATITGTAVMWEDTADTLKAVSSGNPLPVNVVAGGGTGGTAIADESAFTEGTTNFTPVGGVYNETQTPVTEDQAACIRMSSNRNMYVTIRDAAGNERGVNVDASNNLGVAATQTGTWNINNISGAISLPTGASTATNQSTMITSLQTIDNLPHAMNAAFNNACPAAGQLDDTTTTAATEDNIAPVRITAQRAFHTNLRDNTGTEIGTAGSPIRTDPTGSTTQPVSGTINIGTFPDNEPFNVAQIAGTTTSTGNGATDAGTQRVTLSNDSTGTVAATQSGTWNINNISGAISLPTGAATSANQPPIVTDGSAAGTQGNHFLGTDGTNAQIISTNTTGHVNIADGGNSITVDQSTAANLNAQAVGNVAHDAADSGNPIKIGMKAVDFGSTPTAVANSDRTDWNSTRSGVPFVITGFPNPSPTVSNFTTAQTDTSIGPTVAAGERFVLTGLGVYLNNANSADLDITIGYGTATIGTNIWRWDGAPAGGGSNFGNGGGILAVGAANEEIRITTSAAQEVSVVVFGYIIATG